MSSGRNLLLLFGAGVLLIVLAMRAPATFRVAAEPVAPRDDMEVTGDRHDAAVAAVAALGRVEPRSEEIRVGAEMAGKVRALLVTEGQHVEKSAILVTLECAEYAARRGSAGALVAEKQAALARVVTGARDQERLEAIAAADEARALLDYKRADWERRKELFADAVISRDELQRSEHDFLAADARHRAAVQRQALITDAARPEDVSRARADLDFARSGVAEADSALDKCAIRSPITGVVLRTHVRIGENVSASPELPLVTVADISSLRIRAEIDEADIGRVRLHQRVWATAPAYGEQRFYGTLVSVAPILGRKKLTRDDPTERIDTKVLEVLVELEPTAKLPVGLRVDTFFGDR